MKKMKTILSLVIVFLLTMSNNAFAYTTNSWDIKLVYIGDAERYYDSTGEIITYQEKNLINAVDGKEYTISKPELYMRLNYIGALCVLNTYIDGTHAEHTNVLRTETASNGYYADVVVMYLSPGKHKIQIYANSTTIMDTTLEKVTLYVNIPEYTDSEIEKSLQKVNDGVATKNDYENLSINTSKIFGNNGIDISELNEKVKGQNLNITNVQSTVYSIADELKNSKLSEDALMHINAGTASLNHYSTIGIEGVTSSNLNSVNRVIKITRDEKNQDLSKEEIQEIVNEIPNKTEEANIRINNGEGTLKDYALVGATKVTGENLEDVNWYVHGKDNSTVSKLQSNINTILNALSSINNGSTSTSYYKTIGITTVTSDNITAVVNSVKAKKAEKGSDLTRTEIVKVVENTLVNVAGANERINAGQGTLSDYTMQGITNVTAENLEDINWYVQGKDNSTVSKLQSNVNKMKNALAYINNGTTITSYYTTIGITTVTSDNITAVVNSVKAKKAEKGSDLERKEIVKVVEDVLVNVNSANERINAGQGTLEDYTMQGITNVTAENLEDINWYVQGKDNSTVSKLQSNVNKMKNALAYINNGSTSTSYYTTIGITTVTSDNIKSVASSIKAEKATKGSDLTREEIIEVVNEVNSAVNSVSLMMLEEEKISNNKNDIAIEEEQIDINKIDNDDLKIETSAADNQKKQDSEEEKQIKNDIAIEEIDKTVEIDNDLNSKQEEAAAEKQGSEIEEINIEDINKQEDDDTKAVEVNDEVDNQIIENIAV